MSRAYLLLVLGFAVICTYTNLRGHYTIPHSDDWRILDTFFSSSLLPWMFTDQVGHRVPALLLLFYLDYTYFSAQMHLLVVAALACAWVAAGVFYVAFRAESRPLSPVDRAAYAFCIFCVFWAGACFDFVWGTNQGSQQTLALLAIAFTSVAVYQSRLRAQPSAGGLALPAVAVVAAFLATFSHGMGAPTWAGLGLAAIVARLRWRVFGALLVAGVGSVALYGWGLKHVPYGSFWVYLRFVRKNTLAVGKFWLAFIGSPVAHTVGALGGFQREQYFTIGMIGGAIGVAVMLSYGFYLWRRRARAGAIETLCVALMAFSVGGGLLVTVNRFMFPANAVSDRFLTWAALLWIGAIVALVRLARERLWGGWLAVTVFAALSLSMIPGLRQAQWAHGRVRQNLARDAAMHLSGVRWDKLATVGINPKSAPVYRVADRLRRDRRSFFADGRGDLPGTRLVDRFTLLPSERCNATVQFGNEIDARDEPAAMLSGQVWDRGQDGPPAYVVIADSAGIIRGLGTVVMETKPSWFWRGEPKTPASWTGFIQGFVDTEPYTVHAVLAGGQEVCRIGVWQGRQRDVVPGM